MCQETSKHMKKWGEENEAKESKNEAVLWQTSLINGTVFHWLTYSQLKINFILSYIHLTMEGKIDLDHIS